ncbi:MAG: NADP-dependent oxidoreductase [Sandaracinaceae bacterium]
MRAARLHAYGAPDVLRVDDGLPSPTPGARDVLVRVRASSVNPVDLKIRSGGQRAVIRYRLPVIIGLDFAGEVEAVGAAVTRFAVGDRVYGSPTHRRPGCYAEQVCVDELTCARMPTDLTFEEAASIPLVGLTAWDALVVRGRITSGQKILIHAGAGGVGTFAIQLAKSLGAYVATTASAKNHELVRSLGADEAIDYREERFEDRVKDYDLVLDAMGGEVRERSFTVLKKGGRLLTMVSGLPEETKARGPALGLLSAVGKIIALDLRARFEHRVSVHQVLRESSGSLLDAITARIEAGAIRPVIDRTYPLDEIADAHAYMEDGHARGKVVITIGESSDRRASKRSAARDEAE